jgi:hypothetical protein
MGPNYNILIEPKRGKETEELHIGKSSMGWVFSLHVYPERGIRTLYDWLPLLLDSGNVIQDEYGRNVSGEHILKQITCRSRSGPVDWSVNDWDMNSAEPGPNNLVRGKANDNRTPGEGTWDYCDYEFF